MASFNQWIGAGNVTRDPMYKNLPGGGTVVEFGLACNRKFKARDGSDREEVLFIDCAAFGKSAEILNQYVTKGKPLMVRGRLVLHSWDDKDGNKRSKISVNIEEFQFIGGRGDESGGQTQTPQRAQVRGGGARPKQSPPWREEQGDESGMDPSEIPFFWEPHRSPI